MKVIDQMNPGEVWEMYWCENGVCKHCRKVKFEICEVGEFLDNGIVKYGAIVRLENDEIKFVCWSCLENARKIG